MCVYYVIQLIKRSSLFLAGIVGQVFPIKSSERYGKLCKIVLREDLEKRTLRSTCATINAFLLGDLADEGDRIKEGDRVVLSEVVVECSPTDEHLYQLIAWREKSQASIWVINNKGNVRVNNASGNEKTQVNNAEDGKNLTCSADTDEEETVVQETSEPGFYILKKTSTGEEGRRRSKPKIFEKRKGKFHLGPKGVTPSKSHVMRKVSDAVVVIDKSEVTKRLIQKDEMGGVEHLSLSVQNGSPNQPSNVLCTHTELSPAGVSTRICEADMKAGQMRDQSQTSTVPSDLLQLKAPEASALSIVESDVAAEGNYQNNDEVNAQRKTGNSSEHLCFRKLYSVAWYPAQCKAFIWWSIDQWGYTDEKKFSEDRKMNEIDILRKMQKNFMPLIIFTLLLKHLFHGKLQVCPCRGQGIFFVLFKEY